MRELKKIAVFASTGWLIRNFLFKTSYRVQSSFVKIRDRLVVIVILMEFLVYTVTLYVN